MKRLFVGNFEFEHQLAERLQSLGLSSTKRVAVELASAWLGIAQDHDAVWMPAAPDADFPAEMEAEGFPKVHWVSRLAELGELGEITPLCCCPWGWSAEIANWADRQHLTGNPPPLDAVIALNSRRFSFALETELHAGLDQTVQVASIEQWAAALKSFAGEELWVIKSEFGMSARERLLGRGPTIGENQKTWASKRFRLGQVLFLEPWVTAIEEAGLQFEVPPLGQGDPCCLGITPLFTDDAGGYRGSRFDLIRKPELDWSRAEEIGQIVAERAQGLGYFGPLGIDAMWYRDREGTPTLRPLQDVNARWTMGRLSLGFRSLLAAEEAGAWLHLRCPATSADSGANGGGRCLHLFPKKRGCCERPQLALGGQPVKHATAVLIAADAELLTRAMRHLSAG